MAKTLVTAVMGLALAASASWAAPLVTSSYTPNIGGTPNAAIDIFYSAGPGAEFTAYDVIYRVDSSNPGGRILDPIRGVEGQSRLAERP